MGYHPRDEMAAGGVSYKVNGPLFSSGYGGDCRTDLAHDLRDPHLGAQNIARHGDGVAILHAPFRQVRPVGIVQAHPISAMNENDQTAGGGAWPEKIVPHA